MMRMRAIAAALGVVTGVLALSAAPAAAAGPAPTAVPDVYTTDANGQLQGYPALVANDIPAIPGQRLFARQVSGASHGYVSVSAFGGPAYLADYGYEGDDSFTYVAVGPDGVESAPATVTIHVVRPHPDPRTPTKVVFGGWSLNTSPFHPTRGFDLNELGVIMYAKVVTTTGQKVSHAPVELSVGGKYLCTAAESIIVASEYGWCQVPLLQGLPVLLGQKVTGTFYGYEQYPPAQLSAAFGPRLPG